MDGYFPWAEMFICDKDLAISDEKHYWKYYEKFDTDRCRWDAIDTTRLIQHAEIVVDDDLEMF
jgi:hypothetical protein